MGILIMSLCVELTPYSLLIRHLSLETVIEMHEWIYTQASVCVCVYVYRRHRKMHLSFVVTFAA